MTTISPRSAAQRARRAREARERRTRTCPECDQSFERTGRRVYCSVACRKRAENCRAEARISLPADTGLGNHTAAARSRQRSAEIAPRVASLTGETNGKPADPAQDCPAPSERGTGRETNGRRQRLEPYDQGYRDGWHDVHISNRGRRKRRRERSAEYALGYSHGREDGKGRDTEWLPAFAQAPIGLTAPQVAP